MPNWSTATTLYRSPRRSSIPLHRYDHVGFPCTQTIVQVAPPERHGAHLFAVSARGRVVDPPTLQTPVQQAALGQSKQIAVSLEPEGGSPTGAPTGPVLLVAPLSRA